MEDHRGEELRYLLPLAQARPRVLSRLFDQLERERGDIGVSSYGVTACSMDEIFLQLTEEESEEVPTVDADVPTRTATSSTTSLKSNSGTSLSSLPLTTTTTSGSAHDPASPSPSPSPRLRGRDQDQNEGGRLHSNSSSTKTTSRHWSSSSRQDNTDKEDNEDIIGVSSAPLSQAKKKQNQDTTDGLSVGSSSSSSTTHMHAQHRTTVAPAMGDDDSVFDEEGLLFGDTASEDNLGCEKGSMDHLSGARLLLSQYTILLAKRFNYSKRRKVAFLIQNLLPLVVITFSLGIAHVLLSISDQPPFEFSPAQFFKLDRHNYVMVGGYNSAPHTQPFIDSLYAPCGVGSSVLGPSTTTDEKEFCFAGRAPDNCTGYPSSEFQCMCNNCSQSHSDEYAYFSPEDSPSCYNGTQTGSRLQDLTVPLVTNQSSQSNSTLTVANDVMSDYIIRTVNDFIEMRYGGVSFGHARPEVAQAVDRFYKSDSNFTFPFLASHSTAKVWYTLKGYHALPTYLNVLNNAIIRANLDPDKDPALHGIKTFNHPFKTTDLQKLFYAVTELGSFLVNPLAAIFALGFVAAGFVLILIEERSNNVIHIQLVCGMNKIVYWLSSITWDFLSYLLFAAAMLLVYAIFRDVNFINSDAIPGFVVLLVSYGAAVIPWMYCISRLFSSPATGYVFLLCLNFFSGFSLLIVDAIIAFLMNSQHIQFYLVGFPFPSYCLARGMMYYSLDRVFINFIATFSDEPVSSAFNDIWPFIVSLWVQSLLYFALLGIIEALILASKFWSLKDVFSCFKSPSPPLPTDEDESVQSERRRVLEGRGRRRTRERRSTTSSRRVNCKSHDDDNILTLKDITRIFASKGRYRVAVNQLTLGMQKGECFGLLGVNGAGKTTTFKMLTGDTRITHGGATVASEDIKVSMGCMGCGRGVSRGIPLGYCPQVDALIEPLTGREHLTLFARLRGLPLKQVKPVVEQALLKLDLKEFADKPASTYSGGNRRKLSTAIALLAKPPLILLDEPTAGVDPLSRRFLWSVIRGILSSGQSVLLTSHMMSECEALCNRVGIMVNGSFRCLGVPQDLKSLYGEGYKLSVRVRGGMGPVKGLVEQGLPNAVLQEEDFGVLVYQLPNSGLKLSQVYSTLEQIREDLCRESTSSAIEDYSLSQTTLDDVFIHFASQQSEEEGLLEAAVGASVGGKDSLQVINKEGSWQRKGWWRGRRGRGGRGEEEGGRRRGRGEGRRGRGRRGVYTEDTEVQVNLEEDDCEEQESTYSPDEEQRAILPDIVTDTRRGLVKGTPGPDAVVVAYSRKEDSVAVQ